MKNILNRGFSQLSDDALVTKVAFIISQLTGNPSCPTSTPTLVELQAQLLFDASDRAKGYQVETAPDPNAGPWTDYDTFSSSRNIVLKGFPRAKDLWARVRAIGPNNTKSGWSDPATILIS